MDLGRLSAPKCAHCEAVRLRAWSDKARGYGSDDEDQIQTSRFLTGPLARISTCRRMGDVSELGCAFVHCRDRKLASGKDRKANGLKTCFFLVLHGFSNRGKGFYFGTKFDEFVCISLS